MKVRILFLFILLFPIKAMAQDASGIADIPWPEKGIWPEGPRARAFREVSMPAPALVTGACEFSVPLYTLEVEGFSLPLTLQYRSNGIRVEDDPCPIGYGWVLTPALRVTRQIMGRPDEYFDFKGEEESAWFSDDYNLSYGCIGFMNFVDTTSINRSKWFDAEKDIFTIHLIDRSITAVFDGRKFIAAGCDEYTIESDPALSYIRVNDAKGNIYHFGTVGQFLMTKVNRIEWLLSYIQLPSGRQIKMGWEYCNNMAAVTQKFGAMTLRYCRSKFFGMESGKFPDDPIDGPAGNPIDIGGTHNIVSITYNGSADEEIRFVYNGFAGARMLRYVNVRWKGSTVYSVELTRDMTNREKSYLLSGVIMPDKEKYSFFYEEKPFPDNGCTDWWGFYNGKYNDYRFYPSVRLKHGHFPTNLDVPGGDKSPDEKCMQANILKKVIYPTGGSVEWTYEAHRFADSGVSYGDRISNPHGTTGLSFGGGVRVAAIKMTSGSDDSSPRVKRFVYGKNGDGLANVEALPTLPTFISETPVVQFRLDQDAGFECLDGNVYIDRCLTINTRSDYLVGRGGEIPLWYSKVTEYDEEGKTEYEFKRYTPLNAVNRVWGMVYPEENHTTFSKGPQLVRKTVYRKDGNGYSPVERVTNNYDLYTTPLTFTSVTIKRNLLLLEGSDNPPDFGSNWSVTLPLMWYIGPPIPSWPPMVVPTIYKVSFYWYSAYPYTLHLHTERLRSTVTETYTDNGVITETVSHDYVLGTGLVSHTSRARGVDRQETYLTYSKSGAMWMAGLKAVPIEVRNIFNGESSGYRLDMRCWGSDVYRPAQIILSRRSESWSNADYTYDAIGNLLSRVDRAGVDEQWTWGHNGRYPVSHTVAGKLKSTASWKPLVGVVRLDDPARSSRTFLYDSYGRLTGEYLNGKRMATYSYRVGQDGDNSFTTIRQMSDKGTVTTVERYDGLGRLVLTETHLPESIVREAVEYDAMGRPARRSVPFESAPSATDYEVARYEPSPRRLQLATMKAGKEWHAAGKEATVVRLTNIAGSPTACPRFSAASDGFSKLSDYPDGSLAVERMTDEDGVWTETYTDMRGLMVCRRDANGSTYFVYDHLGDLRYVLPPGADYPGKRTDEHLQRLVYWYDYDSRGRLVLAKTPDAKPSRYMYDPADRLVAEQTVNHDDWSWRLYGYDDCGRQVVAWDRSSVDDADVVQFASVCRKAVLASGYAPAGYALAPGPALSLGQVVWARYYDTHDFISVLGLSDDFGYAVPDEYGNKMPATPSSAAGRLTGIYTGRGYEAFYHDLNGDVIQRVATGYNVGRTSTVYDLAGVPSMIWHDYAGSGFDLDTLEEMFYRDSAGRVWVYNFYPDQGYGAQVEYGYDRLGRLSSIYMDGAAEVTLGYDIHGWPLWQRTEPVAAPATEWRLGYAGGAAPRYSGSISSRQWSGGRYDYRYDLSGRLYGAVHTAPSGAAPGTDFSATYGYDALGNLTSVTRQGVVERTPGGTETFGAVDDHTIDVVAARPERIERRRFHVIEPPIVLYGVGAVSPSEPIESHDLTYDESGRLVSDGCRGISAVTYNYDGLPVSISFTDGHTQNNVYDGLGRLLQTSYSVFTPGVVGAGVPGGTIAVTGVRRYTGDGHVLYSGGGLYPRTYTLERHHFADGYLDGAGDAHFLVRDYRGNVTDVIASDGSVEQHTDYYPCGLPWRAVSGVNRRLFEGKEYLTDDGLDEYDYGARRYTPRFGMFTTPDPHGWRTPWLSAYCAFACNPVMNIDPTGMEFTHYGELSANRLAREAQRKMDSTDDADMKAQYLQVINEIDEMRQSDQLFAVAISGRDSGVGSTYYDLEMDAVVMALPGGTYAGYDIMAHEFKHGHQFLSGEMDLSIKGSVKEGRALFYDVYDEKQAYDRGALFGGDVMSIEDISANTLYDNKKILQEPTDCYNVRGFTGYDSSNEGNPRLDPPRFNFAERNHKVFRIGNKTYTPKR